MNRQLSPPSIISFMFILSANLFSRLLTNNAFNSFQKLCTFRQYQNLCSMFSRIMQCSQCRRAFSAHRTWRHVHSLRVLKRQCIEERLDRVIYVGENEDTRPVQHGPRLGHAWLAQQACCAMGHAGTTLPQTHASEYDWVTRCRN